jgi:predicted acetyltransferase
MLQLIEPDEKYTHGYRDAYNGSMEKHRERIIKKHNFMFLNPDEIDIIQRYADNRDPAKLKPGYVPNFTYFLVDDNNFIGFINIRTCLTDALLRYGGNIGYAVNPAYWRNGYGTKLLELGLRKAKEMVTDNKVLLTCDDDNIGSYKIIEKNGGVLENKVQNESEGETFLTRRYWIKI